MSPGDRTRGILAGAVAVVLSLSILISGGAVAGPRNGAGPEERRSASRFAEGVRMAQAGEVTPEKLERWRAMTPEEREKLRGRYHRWKELSPERRERILERRRMYRELPEEQRRFLRQRREIYRDAWPEEKRAIEKFSRRWRNLPPERRHSIRNRMSELRDLPASERNKRMMDWTFYRKLTPAERKAVDRFLFSEPPRGPKGGPPRAPRD